MTDNDHFTPKYPGIHIKLIGLDGNAFSILGRVRKAMKKAGLPDDIIDDYHTQATSGDYDHLLQTTMSWFNTDTDEVEDCQIYVETEYGED
jgi:hypothetical protein